MAEPSLFITVISLCKTFCHSKFISTVHIPLGSFGQPFVFMQYHANHLIFPFFSERIVFILNCRFFKQTKYTSFQRQLSLYGFIRLTRNGPDRGGYYHPKFLRISRTYSRNIPRIKVKNEGPRKAAAPDCDPDFYGMPKLLDAIHKADACRKTGSPGPAPTSVAVMSAGASVGGVSREDNSSSANSQSIRLQNARAHMPFPPASPQSLVSASTMGLSQHRGNSPRAPESDLLSRRILMEQLLQQQQQQQQQSQTAALMHMSPFEAYLRGSQLQQPTATGNPGWVASYQLPGASASGLIGSGAPSSFGLSQQRPPFMGVAHAAAGSSSSARPLVSLPQSILPSHEALLRAHQHSQNMGGGSGSGLGATSNNLGLFHNAMRKLYE